MNLGDSQVLNRANVDGQPQILRGSWKVGSSRGRKNSEIQPRRRSYLAHHMSVRDEVGYLDGSCVDLALDSVPSRSGTNVCLIT